MATPINNNYSSPSRFCIAIDLASRTFSSEPMADVDVAPDVASYWVPAEPKHILYLVTTLSGGNGGEPVHVELFESLEEAEALADLIDFQAFLAVTVRAMTQCDVDRLEERMRALLSEDKYKQARGFFEAYNDLIAQLEIAHDHGDVEKKEEIASQINRLYVGQMREGYSYYGQMVECPDQINLRGLRQVEVIVLHKVGSNILPRRRASHDY